MKIVKTDGTEHPLVPDEPKGRCSLKLLQKAVGGYIEKVPGHLMLVDEEGKLKSLEINPIATRIVGQIIVGDVVIFDSAAELRRAMG